MISTLPEALPALAIPTSLRDSLVARLDRLAPVKGRHPDRRLHWPGVLLRAARPELAAARGTTQGGLRKLTEAGLVYSRGTAPDATYAFKHALVQDVAYDSLLKSKKHELHARLAQKYWQGRLRRPGCQRAGAAGPSLHAGGKSTDAAIACGAKRGSWRARVALQEAVGHFQQGLALIEQLPHSSARNKLELSIREPLNGAWMGWRGWPASRNRVTLQLSSSWQERRGIPSPADWLWGLGQH